MGLRSWIRSRIKRQILLDLASKLEKAAQGGGGGSMDWQKAVKWVEGALWFIAPIVIDRAVEMLGAGQPIDPRALGMLCLATLGGYIRRQAQG